MKILVHLVSGQNLPNYIASKIVRPDKEQFLFTKGSLSSLKILENVLGSQLEPIAIPAWDYSQIYISICDFIKKYSNDELVLNFTGGNKIMSQAAFSAFEDNHKDCIYINSENDEYIFFKHSSGNLKVEKNNIEVAADLVDYIKLNGQNIEFEDKQLTQAQKKLIDLLQKDFKIYAGHILKASSKYMRNAHIDLQFYEGKLKGSFIKYNGNETSIRFNLKGKETFYANEKGDELLHLCFGKWFEHSCYNAIESASVFNQIKINCHIQKNSRREEDYYSDKNELDILAIKGIYPTVFECKSGGIKSEHVDKLVAIKQTYLGRYAAVFLITYFPLNDNDEVHLMLKEKMNENKIIHLSFKDLNKRKLLEFITKKENLR